jgi:hypothetical protein
MFSNGVVGFLNPQNSWCCTGFDLRTNNGSPFNYAIMPLQTDLLNYNGKFLTEGTPQYQRYKWENISEFGVPENLNTFGVEIKPSGYIGMHYEKVNISPWRPITMGMTGNTSQGEYTQYYHGAGFNSVTPTSYITEATGSACLFNPLFSPSCAGYQEAFLAQQCSASQLYSPQCPYYAEAYLSQQCNANALYDRSCAGYEAAYFNQQCSLNPLYNSRCSGYEQAYFTQQCTANPLYDRNCSGYSEAYALQNVVPSTSTSTTLTVAAPQLVVSTSGAVSVETPVIADPVVNEVVTRRPETTAARVEQRQEQRPEPAKKEEKKEDKKEEKKDDKKVEQRRALVQKQMIEQATSTVAANTEVKIYDSGLMKDTLVIQDRLYARMLGKPLQDNQRLNRRMQEDSNILYRELEDGQWRRD